MSASHFGRFYTDDELKTLYPAELELALVQVILRHGERAPTSIRFQNTGLPQYWPYCSAARQLRSAALSEGSGSTWSTFQWRRRLERFNEGDDRATFAAGPAGDIDDICRPGELTDEGRRSTYQLGQRLRHLYVHQLRFLPETITDREACYLRATEVPRAIESAQQTWLGMYPQAAGGAAMPHPTITIRALREENLFPNNFHCGEFARLLEAFGKQTARKWNESEEVDYINDKISKWMPASSPRVAVDSKPRLYEIMDTIHATRAHGPATRLPDEFYDPKALGIIDKIEREEWYGGYGVNRKFRTLGIGSYVGDVVDRMITKVQEHAADHNIQQLQQRQQVLGPGLRFALYGCHDVTLAAFLASFGAFDNQTWPHFTSHIAVELFREKEMTATNMNQRIPLVSLGTPKDPETSANSTQGQASGLKLSEPLAATNAETTNGIDMIRRPWSQFSRTEKKRLDRYYVRLRYNGGILTVPGCARPGMHLEGNDAFCTLEAFKRIADGFIPANWKQECAQVSDDPTTGFEPGTEQKPGHIEEGF